MAHVLQLHAVCAEPAQSARHFAGSRVASSGAWEVERDVIRGRTFDRTAKFMPDGLSQAVRLEFLDSRERVLLSQVQGRTYANVLGMLEKCVGANMLELSRSQLLGDEASLEALVQCTQDEIKHQQLFSRIDLMMAGAMPRGYRFRTRPNDFTWLVLGRSRWSVLALTCMAELVSQSHYRESIAPDPSLSALYKDVFFFHWLDEERHAAVSEREWRNENARLTDRERGAAVDDFLEIVRTLNVLLQRQAAADTEYFVHILKRELTPLEAGRVQSALIRAYRWQHILAGIQHERFANVLAELVSEELGARISAALLPIAAWPEPRALAPIRRAAAGVL